MQKLLEALTLAEEAIEEGLATFSIPTTAKIAEALAAIHEQKAELEKQRDGAVAQTCFGAGAAWHEQDAMKKAAYELSKWLSAALDDPKVCEEYKNAINGWYDAAMPFLPIKTGKLHRNVLLQALGGLLAGEYSLDAHSLDMYPSKNDDLQQIYDAKAAVKRELEGMATPVQQVKQEPVGVVECSGEWGIAGVLVAGVSIGTKLYAAPVRTKDLTDDEIGELIMPVKPIMEFARAVIAADREKNK